MDRNQWQRIEELFHAASELADEERAVFLHGECAGDEDLLREVESLIAASNNGDSFIEQPTLSFGMKVISDSQKESLAGQSIGHYKIVRLLGEGGMGEVYLADDCILERKVALKFLAPWLVDDKWAREQLMAEARAVARLENPNICPVYGFEEISDHHFMVMQYVEGQTLAALLDQGPLDLDQVLDLAEQMISALSAAHLRGIIHRDVKPQNIVVTADGQAKVLDFGLAKFVQQSQSILSDTHKLDQTSPLGSVPGTVAYMSPEQTRGDQLDCRSDIFSFGIVLYEMLGGQNPFLRNTREGTIAATREEEPLPLPAALPADLIRISRKCLEKTLPRRYETAEQLRLELHGLRKSRDRTATLAWRQHLKYYAAAAALLLTILLSAAGYAYRKVTTVHTLAVLPITNKSGDPEKNYLSEGLTRNLFDKFSYLPRMQVKSPTVATATKNEELARLGRELKVEAVLSGEIFRQDQSLVLRLTMLKTSTGVPSWEQDFNLDAADMLSLEDDITGKVTSNLGVWLIGDEKKLLIKRQTNNEDALRFYMKGRVYLDLKRDRENLRLAVQFFQQAVELDPAFAKAYTGLADCYLLNSNVAYGPIPTKEAMEKAHWNAKKALDIDPLLAEAHSSMGNIRLRYDWEWQQAEQEFKQAIELDPEYAPAHYAYTNLLAVLGRFDESIKQSEISKELDPYSTYSNLNYGRALYYARRYDEAAAHFRKLLAEKPDHTPFLLMMGLVSLAQGQYQDAVVSLERLHSKEPLTGAASLGFAYAKLGRRDEAMRMLGELDAFSAEKPVPPHEKALVYVGLGEKDKAFELLERAFQERFPNLIYLTTDPVYDDLRPDRRFAEFARRLNLTL